MRFCKSYLFWVVPTYPFCVLDATPYLALCTAIEVQNNMNSMSYSGPPASLPINIGNLCPL